MTHRICTIGAALALLVFAGPAPAVVSDWQSSEGGRMRLSALAEDSSGKVTALLEIDPKPGWKTYWRNPGDAGMAPQVDLSAAENLRLVKVNYPAPEIGTDEAGRFFGYHQRVGLVVELEKPDPSRPSRLSANVLVGLCAQICLPFQAEFDLPLADASRPQADEFMNINMARLALPETPSPGFGIRTSGLSENGDAFEATVTIPGKEMPEIAVAPSEGLLLGPMEASLQDGLLRLRSRIVRKPASTMDTTVTLLIRSAGRSMEATLAVR